MLRKDQIESRQYGGTPMSDVTVCRKCHKSDSDGDHFRVGVQYSVGDGFHKYDPVSAEHSRTVKFKTREEAEYVLGPDATAEDVERDDDEPVAASPEPTLKTILEDARADVQSRPKWEQERVYGASPEGPRQWVEIVAHLAVDYFVEPARPREDFYILFADHLRKHFYAARPSAEVEEIARNLADDLIDHGWVDELHDGRNKLANKIVCLLRPYIPEGPPEKFREYRQWMDEQIKWLADKWNKSGDTECAKEMLYLLSPGPSDSELAAQSTPSPVPRGNFAQMMHALCLAHGSKCVTDPQIYKPETAPGICPDCWETIEGVHLRACPRAGQPVVASPEPHQCGTFPDYKPCIEHAGLAGEAAEGCFGLTCASCDKPAVTGSAYCVDHAPASPEGPRHGFWSDTNFDPDRETAGEATEGPGSDICEHGELFHNCDKCSLAPSEQPPAPAAPEGAAPPDAQWLVWSCEHELWWRANRHGYTSVIDEAGRYSLEEAIACCKARSPRADGKPNEIAVPSPESIEAYRGAVAEVRELAEIVGKAICEATLSAGETIQDAPGHKVFTEMHRLRLRAETAESEVRELRVEKERWQKQMQSEVTAAHSRAEAAEKLRDEYPETAQRIQGDFERAKSALDEAQKDAQDWKRHWEMYRKAWVRELGGWIIPKAHDIDSLVLTTRKRCVNPLLGNCVTPHWLGKPTDDGKALQQTPHPRDNSCKNWKADDSEPNPRAESAEAALKTAREELEAYKRGERVKNQPLAPQEPSETKDGQ